MAILAVLADGGKEGFEANFNYGTMSAGQGVLDEPYSAKSAQRSSHTGPPCEIGWTRFQPIYTGGPVRQFRRGGLADYKVSLKLPPLVSYSPLSLYVWI